LGTGGVIGNGDGQFRNPADVAVNGDTVYVADWMNHRIQKFTTTGTFLGKWGSFGAGNGQFYGVSAVTMDEGGNVYASDWNNFRVQKFTSSGVFVTAWGEWGQGPGEFANPAGLSTDADGNVYVADWGNDRVQKFTPDGGI
jgi:sugar lactone lactonase YvrE